MTNEQFPVAMGLADGSLTAINTKDLNDALQTIKNQRAEIDLLREALLAWYEASDDEERRWAMEKTAPLKDFLRSGSHEPEEAQYQMQLKRTPYGEIARFLAEDDAARGSVLGIMESM